MKVGDVGAGFVGSTSADALVMTGVGSEIVLADKNRSRAEAEDIFHAVPFAHSVRITAACCDLYKKQSLRSRNGREQ